MQRFRALPDHLDVVDMGAIAGEQFQRGIDLVIARGRTLVALDQHDAGAVVDRDQRARERRSGLLRRDKQQV